MLELKVITPVQTLLTSWILFLGIMLPVGAWGHDISILPVFAFPTGGFSRHVDSLIMGIDAEYQWSIENFKIGVSTGYWTYGKQDILLNQLDEEVSSDLKYHLDNSLVKLHLKGTLFLDDGMWRPYIGGFVGQHLFFTQIVTRDAASLSELRIVDSKLTQTSSVWAYGLHLGTLIVIRKARPNYEGVVPFTASIDARISLNLGGTTDYFAVSSVEIDDGIVDITPFRSPTDMLVFHIGFNLNF